MKDSATLWNPFMESSEKLPAILFIEAVIAVGFPHLIHFKVVFLDKRLNLAELLIGQCTLLLYDRAAVTAYKELCGGAFGQHRKKRKFGRASDLPFLKNRAERPRDY